jgi:hypothetical protein
MSARAITPEMKAVADALLGWTGTSRFGASDVLVWWRNPSRGRVGIAFRGDALRIERAVLLYDRQMMANQVFQRSQRLGFLDQDLQRVLDVDVGQTMGTPDEVYTEVLSAVERTAGEKLMEEDVSVTLMPNEGAPWVPGTAATEFYSAKKHRAMVSPAPSWAIEGTWREDGEDHKGPVADVCALVAPLAEERTGTAAVGRLRGVEFFATHSFDPMGRGRDVEKVIASIQRCEGLLYPSLAVGHLPASIFGLVSLFCDVRLPLLGIKPYKMGRGNYPVVLYGHDTWTDTTSHFLGVFARELFLQLTGNSDRDVRHMAVLGPALSSGGPVDEEASLIGSITKLGATLAKRTKVWKERADVDAVTNAHWNQPERYPYLEAKVHARLPMSKFVLATAPVALKEPALRFLRAIGYAGPLALVDLGDVALQAITSRGDSQAVYDYAWRVRQAVLELAEKDPRFAVDIVS